MLKKALITVVLLVVALTINGTNTPAAIGFGGQELRPVPAEPRTIDTSAFPSESDEVKEEFHQTYPLTATGRVSVENLNGGVQIKVWDRAAVQIDAIKRAYRRERLTEAVIEVNSTAENIRIRTEYPGGNQSFYGDDRRYDNPAIVDYTLTVPRKAMLESIELVNGSIDIDGAEGSVKATSINGRLTARNLAGEAKLSTINGPLQATFTQLDESKPISLGSVNGPVTLVIPSNANALVRAGTVHGGISNDFGIQVQHGEFVGHNLDGQIGTGGPKIKLGNVNGSIRITHAQDGQPVSPGVSISVDKDKRKNEGDEDLTNEIQEAGESAAKVATRAVDAARIAKEAQQQVEQALREAQREYERAQLEVQREVRQRVREQVRAEGEGRGRGEGVGAGVGSGHGRFTSQETKSFPVSGIPRVVVSTFDGAITVHGWDKAEVAYTANKRGDDEESLKEVIVDAKQNGSEISISARSDEERNGSVDMEVFVPKNSVLHVSSDDGALKLDKVTGEVTLRTGDGSIEVSEGGGQLQVNTGDGRVQVLSFNGQVDARTGDGSINLDGTFTELAARTGDGSITLSVPGSSNFTIETNADNEVTNQGLNMTEEITPSKRFKRWSVGSGGKVFILKTGDGRILLRSR